ncbi:MAG: hypothetical protein OXL97_11775 [Chloroflexota bacterium]|nr:hypothetical protein [Chloroflexota bacterium]MDE2884643.1 hypothetical protein [Chloroflexota bacterium]
MQVEESKRQLMAAVQDSLKNIDMGVVSYVSGRDSAYRSVAVELRKLLLDKKAIGSFVRASKPSNLFELAFGKGDRIYVQSFMPKSVLTPKDGFLMSAQAYTLLLRAFCFTLVRLTAWYRCVNG